MKRAIISALLISFLIPASAQKEKEEPLNMFDIRFGLIENGNFMDYSGMKGYFRIDFNYNLSKYISLGG